MTDTVTPEEELIEPVEDHGWVDESGFEVVETDYEIDEEAMGDA